MRTCLGAAAELCREAQLPRGWAAGAVLVHCEGYMLYRPAFARAVLRAARQAGALVRPSCFSGRSRSASLLIETIYNNLLLRAVLLCCLLCFQLQTCDHSALFERGLQPCILWFTGYCTRHGKLPDAQQGDALVCAPPLGVLRHQHLAHH